MPGLILEISVVVGQTVKENDSLLILEAMKMENSFSFSTRRNYQIDIGRIGRCCG
jgi:acetyl/propionyl-CoA carboxylase alpha subunit